MNDIEPGDGWRLIGPDEVIKAGDEFWRDAIPLFKHEAGWIPTISGFIGLVAHGFKIRRRIPAKPESISMMDYRGVIAVTGLPETVTIEQVFYGEESDFVVIETVQNARQLADWLTRYADWREAQDAGK